MNFKVALGTLHAILNNLLVCVAGCYLKDRAPQKAVLHEKLRRSSCLVVIIELTVGSVSL